MVVGSQYCGKKKFEVYLDNLDNYLEYRDNLDYYLEYLDNLDYYLEYRDNLDYYLEYRDNLDYYLEYRDNLDYYLDIIDIFRIFKSAISMVFNQINNYCNIKLKDLYQDIKFFDILQIINNINLN
jgi:hypothetical protein